MSANVGNKSDCQLNCFHAASCDNISDLLRLESNVTIEVTASANVKGHNIKLKYSDKVKEIARNGRGVISMNIIMWGYHCYRFCVHSGNIKTSLDQQYSGSDVAPSLLILNGTHFPSSHWILQTQFPLYKSSSNSS